MLLYGACFGNEAIKSVTRTMTPKVKPAVDLGLNTSRILGSPKRVSS